MLIAFADSVARHSFAAARMPLLLLLMLRCYAARFDTVSPYCRMLLLDARYDIFARYATRCCCSIATTFTP